MVLNQIHNKSSLLIFLAVIFIITAIWTASIPRIETWQLMSGFGLSFLFYLLIMARAESSLIYILFITSIAVRVGLIFLFPQLSDDIYRFYWDGILVESGINPYGLLPINVDTNNLFPSEGWLLNVMNSPGYYTVYPPILQGVFWLGALGNDIYGFSIILKIIFILVECIGFYYLVRYLKNKSLDTLNVFWYFLNPLVIIEGVGNLHAEVLMIALLSIFLFYWNKGSMVKASIFFSIAISIKLIPLILIPFLWFSKRKNRLTFVIGTISTLLLLFTPIWLTGKWMSYAASLDLYFRKFEFNASVYYILRAIGIWWKGYNVISLLGPILGFVSMALILWLSWKKRNIFQLTGFSIVAWFVYLILSTTVHPWYIIPLLFFSSIHANYVPILWSGLIFLTYINYGTQPFKEQIWVVVLEYSLILIYIVLTYRDILQKIKSQLT